MQALPAVLLQLLAAFEERAPEPPQPGQGFTMNELLRRHEQGDPVRQPPRATMREISPMELLTGKHGDVRVMGRRLKRSPAETPSALRRKYWDS